MNTPLINPKKVYLPPLNIKLLDSKIFVKAMDQNNGGFMYVKNKFT